MDDTCDYYNRSIAINDIKLGDANIVARMSRLLDPLSYLLPDGDSNWARALSNREVLITKPIIGSNKQPLLDYDSYPNGYLAYKRHKKYIQVFSIGVEPDFRRQGICRRLLQHLILTKPKSMIEISVPNSMIEIGTLLISLGFSSDYTDTVKLLTGKTEKFYWFSALT